MSLDPGLQGYYVLLDPFLSRNHEVHEDHEDNSRRTSLKPFVNFVVESALPQKTKRRIQWQSKY